MCRLTKSFKNKRLPIAPWPSEGRGQRFESSRARHFSPVLTGDMFNSLSGMNGFRAGFHPAPFIIEVPKVVVEETHQPDLVIDLSDAYGLAGESG